jgi:membrane fusion protein (multidrug efflux system)
VKRTFVACCAGALVLGVSIAGCGEKKAPPPPPPAVQVAQVIQRDVPIYVEAVGQTRGSKEVEIRARVEGYIQSVDFAEGTTVQQGQRLFTIDPKAFEATVAQAKGRLAGAQAQLAKARQDVARYTPLAAKNAIPRQDLDTAIAVEHAATAGVEAESAAAKSAEIDLGYTRVVSPVTGLVGKAEVKTGNLVGRGESTLLTTVSTIDPIHVRVAFAERDYLTMIRRRLQEVKEHGGEVAAPTDSSTIEMVLADGSLHPQRGKVYFVDRAVDPTTGTLLVEIEFPNPDKIVRPGQFAKIRAPVDFRRGAILVPQRAVQEVQATYSVAVVAPGDTIEMRPVKTGARLGTLYVIEAGLQPGERVVVEGLQKVQKGMKVQPTMVEISDPNLGTASQQAAAAASH